MLLVETSVQRENIGRECLAAETLILGDPVVPVCAPFCVHSQHASLLNHAWEMQIQPELADLRGVR